MKICSRNIQTWCIKPLFNEIARYNQIITPESEYPGYPLPIHRASNQPDQTRYNIPYERTSRRTRWNKTYLEN